MKKNIIYTTLLVILAMTTQSCLFQEEDIFDKPASQRISEQKELITETLISSSNGWLMQYFPTESSPGLSFLMKFSEEGQVVIASQNPYQTTYAEATSLWKVISGTSVVLTFDTHNPILHRFSDPLGGTKEGTGLEGDHEFIATKVEPDKISLRGLKRSTRIEMLRLQEGQDWKTFFEEIELMQTNLFYNNSPDLVLNVGEKKYLFSYAGTSMFSVTELDEKTAEAITIPFVITTSGLRLYKPETLTGNNTQSFSLNEENTELISLEDSGIKLKSAYSIVEYFNQKENIDWILDTENMSEDMKVLYQKIDKSARERFTNVTKVEMFIGRRSSGGKTFYGVGIAITRKTGAVIDGIVMLEKAIQSNEVINLQLVSGSGTSNGKSFYSGGQSIDGFKDYVDLFSGNFLLSSPTPINPINMKFVSEQNLAIWFVVRK